MADNCEEQIQAALQNNDQAPAAEKAQKYLDKLNKVPLNIAITGESGSGKSTLVNALRGIKNNTEGAAPTGVKETTMKPTEYLHPEYPNITVWDLPGIGTTRFTAAKYLKQMRFEKYDFFIIVSDKRFQENDAKLAKKIQKMKKKFYFVRSKIDNNIQDEKKNDPNVKEEDVLNIIRNNCTEELQKLGIESPKIFLVSSFKLDLYEFEDLWKTLDDELPEHQRDALLLSLPNISLDAIKQKEKTLGIKIIWYTVGSTAVAAVPVPFLSDGVDLSIIAAFAVHCLTSLGLTPKSLRRLSELSGVPLDDLQAEIKSPLAAVGVTPDLVLKVSAASITAMVIEEGARFIPFIGIPLAMCISGVTTYKVLKYILNSLTEDAQRVFIKAWGRTHLCESHVSPSSYTLDVHVVP